MKIALLIVVVVAVLALLSAWLFFPASLPVYGEVWVIMGRPGLLGRMGFCLFFFVLIFFLAARLGKSGPI